MCNEAAERRSKTKIGGVNQLKAGGVLANGGAVRLLMTPPHTQRLVGISGKFSTSLILAVTDNVVRPADVITSAPPSAALRIIPDYVVIPLILIALRFQSKYGNSIVALRSDGVLNGPPDRPAASIFLPSAAVNKQGGVFAFPRKTHVPARSVGATAAFAR